MILGWWLRRKPYALSLLLFRPKVFVQDASWAGVLGVYCSSVTSFSPPRWIHGLPNQGEKEEEELVFGCEIKASGCFVFTLDTG